MRNILLRVSKASPYEIYKKLAYKIYRRLSLPPSIFPRISRLEKETYDIEFMYFNSDVHMSVGDVLDWLSSAKPPQYLEPTLENWERDARFSWEIYRLNWLHGKVLEAGHVLENERVLAQEKAVFVKLTLLSHWHEVAGRYTHFSWSSAMEAAIRLINLTLFYKENSRFFDGETREFFFSVIAYHRKAVNAGRSIGSSLNNHTIVEDVALVLANSGRGDHEVVSRNLLETIDRLYQYGELRELASGYQVASQDYFHICRPFIHPKLIAQFDSRVSESEKVTESFFYNAEEFFVVGDWDYSRHPLAKKMDKRASATDASYLTRHVGQSSLLLDCAGPGLPPLFGHTHDDLGQVLFAYDGKLIISNGGTEAYGLGLSTRRFDKQYSSHSVCRASGPYFEVDAPFITKESKRVDIEGKVSQAIPNETKLMLRTTLAESILSREVSLFEDGFQCVDTVDKGSSKHSVHVVWQVLCQDILSEDNDPDRYYINFLTKAGGFCLSIRRDGISEITKKREVSNSLYAGREERVVVNVWARPNTKEINCAWKKI